MNWAEQISRDLEAVRKEKPLVHNITNYVVMNTTANTLLALGASPVMAHALEEVEEMAELSRALVLNIGTLSPLWVAAMYKAARAAEKKNVPIVVDPVGAGATRYRTLTAQALLSRYKVNVLRGNASEILAVHGGDFQTKGVDAAHSVEQARVSARELAKKHGIVVAVTGPEDYVTDGSRVARIQNGHALLGRITGSGCAASAVTGAFCAVDSDFFAASVGALVAFGIAGELAAEGNPGPGTFQARLFDMLDALKGSDVQRLAKVTAGD